MRITDENHLKKASKRAQAKDGAGGGMSDWAIQQIERQLQGQEGSETSRKKPAKAAVRQISGESPGEASLRLALRAAFGEWNHGGEVVQELIPFQDRGFRADFALPRYRIYVEVLGWTVHGKHKSDHLMDCERSLYFSSRGWLPFYASHKDATKAPGYVVDAIRAATSLVEPCCRSEIQLRERPHKHGVWYQLERPSA